MARNVNFLLHSRIMGGPGRGHMLWPRKRGFLVWIRGPQIYDADVKGI
jgi:endo-1,4-beta-D-glucanase Y